MITISLCMIVRNEEAVLERCLASAAPIADEMIIVDTGSTDATKEIARRFGAKIYDFTWVDDFSAARNYSFAQATMDYQLWLDADDVLPPPSLAGLLALKQQLDPAVDIVTMPYHTAFDAAGRPAFTTRRSRLLRRSSGFRWLDPVHEYIPQRGRVQASELPVHHLKQGEHGDRNLNIYLGIKARGEQFSPRSTYYFARELMDHTRFDEAAEQFTIFLDDGRGWVEDNITACRSLAYCHAQLGQPQQQMAALLRSFSYDLPRPPICCELGYFYKNRADFHRAAYWFHTALNCPAGDNGGFFQPDFTGYIPHLELCVCYCQLEQFDKAVYHNEQAGLIKPESAAVNHNREYLASAKL